MESDWPCTGIILNIPLDRWKDWYLYFRDSCYNNHKVPYWKTGETLSRHVVFLRRKKRPRKAYAGIDTSNIPRVDFLHPDARNDTKGHLQTSARLLDEQGERGIVPHPPEFPKIHNNVSDVIQRLVLERVVIPTEVMIFHSGGILV